MGKYFNDTLIISPEEINNYNYDYVFITNEDLKIVKAALTRCRLSDSNIICYTEFLNNIFLSPEFYINYFDFMNNEKSFEGLITGISYAQKGIKAESFKKKFFNLAAPSQDLYYDYEMIKFTLKFKELKANLKYVIIGLCYYSFEYDLSLGIDKNRVWYYYPVTGKIHNYTLKSYMNFFYDFYNKSKKILLDNHVEIIWKTFMENHYRNIIENGSKNHFNYESLLEDEIIKIEEEVKKTFKKNYPYTVEENKNIFRNYLELLGENGIKPIVVVCPQTKIFQKFIPEKMKIEFESIIKEFKSQYDFQFIDYTYSCEFIDDDFRDYSHLNVYGAAKFAEILDKKIEW